MIESNEPTPASSRPERAIFSNRTLNLRSIAAIGYDMDYTLVHYRVEEWERRAFDLTRDRLVEQGWPIGDLEFDPAAVIRGLVLDLELGNLVKATRFGYVIRAMHGTRMLDFDELRRTYAGTFVDLAEERYVIMNTLFSLSEAGLYTQLVDLVDAGAAPGVMGYEDLYTAIRSGLDRTHLEGKLKAEILADPARFIVEDAELAQALLDQQAAGKRLMLITNAEWEYTYRVMTYAFDGALGPDQTWRDLFDTVIVSADKPGFFTGDRPFYKVVDEGLGLLRPHYGPIAPGDVFYGGNAMMLEESIGLEGDQILYVGDHLYGDVHVSKAVHRWRTALILRELEDEVRAHHEFRPAEHELEELMAEKVAVERELALVRLQELRRGTAAREDAAGLLRKLAELDDRIAPLAVASGTLRNPTWGPLMRAGIDKSIFARQVERYADVYTSRASNFLHATPFGLVRAPKASLPHDVDVVGAHPGDHP